MEPRAGTQDEAMANALTALRLLLVVPFAFFMTEETRSAVFALIVWVVALVTDFLDGPIARRRGTVTARAGHSITPPIFSSLRAAFCRRIRGVFPWILPVLIVAAFSQYVIDSYWIHRQAKLRGSKLGRYNGMLYFAPTCMEIVIRLGARFLQPLLTILVWVLVLSTLASMGQRLMFSRLPEHLPTRSPEK